MKTNTFSAALCALLALAMLTACASSSVPNPQRPGAKLCHAEAASGMEETLPPSQSPLLARMEYDTKYKTIFDACMTAKGFPVLPGNVVR